MARPAARVHAGGHQYRRRANPPGSPHRRTMEQARAIPAHDLRRGTAAAAQPQEPARPTTRARTRQNARHRQITRRTATQIRRTSQSLRTPHGRKTSPKRRRPRQVRRTSQPAQQKRERPPKHAPPCWQGALDTLRLPGERISSRWLGTEALMLASAPTSPRRSSPKTCSWQPSNDSCPTSTSFPTTKRSPTQCSTCAKCTRTPCTRWRMT